MSSYKDIPKHSFDEDVVKLVFHYDGFTFVIRQSPSETIMRQADCPWSEWQAVAYILSQCKCPHYKRAIKAALKIFNEKLASSL